MFKKIGNREDVVVICHYFRKREIIGACEYLLAPPAEILAQGKIRYRYR